MTVKFELLPFGELDLQIWRSRISLCAGRSRPTPRNENAAPRRQRRFIAEPGAASHKPQEKMATDFHRFRRWPPLSQFPATSSRCPTGMIPQQRQVWARSWAAVVWSRTSFMNQVETAGETRETWQAAAPGTKPASTMNHSGWPALWK